LAFHYEFLKGVTNDVVQIADELLSKLENNVTTISSMSEFKKITGEVIGRIFFGERLNDFSFKGQPLTLFLSDLIIRIGVIGFDPLYLMFGINFVKFGLTKKHRELFKDIKEFRKICE
jgi:cytochrome P450